MAQHERRVAAGAYGYPFVIQEAGQIIADGANVNESYLSPRQIAQTRFRVVSSKPPRHHLGVLERDGDLALEASGGNGGYLQAECPEVWNAPGIVRVLFGAWRASLSEARDRSPMVVDTSTLLRLIP